MSESSQDASAGIEAKAAPSSGTSEGEPQSQNSQTKTLYNTRATSFLSKESSVTLFADSKEHSFISVDDKTHLAARLGALPETSPNEGKPLIDSDGDVRHLSPRNVKLEQFYTEVDQSESNTEPTRGKNCKSVGALSEPKASTEEDTVPQAALQAETAEDNTKKEQEEDAGLFSTQVDEDVLEAAKKRQSGFSDPAWMNRDDSLPTMQEVVNGKAEEHFQKGLVHASNTEFEQAIQCYNKAVNLRSKDIRIYIERAEAFLQLTEFQSAILNYKRACVLQPENEALYNRLAFIYFFQGQCLFDQKLFPEALEAFSRATEMRPDVIGYHTRSIACLAALQRHGECLALVNKRLEVEQHNADLYIMRARLHQLFRNTTLCYYDIKDALAIDPDHPESINLMKQLEAKSIKLKQQATQLNLVGRHRDALQKISIAIETNPSVAEYHVMRGALHRRLSDFNAAIDDYLLALDKTDHDEDSAVYQESQRQLLLTYNDFAVECFTKAYYEEAIILLNKAIKGEKREKGLYINRGDCFFKEGNLQFAMADYHQALELDLSDPNIRSRIAIIHNEYGVQEFQEKNNQEAENRFTLAIQHNPKVGQYYISRCRTRQMMENMSAARQDILIALLLDPTNPEVMPILTRMFPGKSVKDILHSRATHQARQALENLVLTASPIRMRSLNNGDDATLSDQPAGDDGQTGEQITEADDTDPPITRAWQPAQCFPDLKSCMEEKMFNIKIATEKNKLNQKVKDALQQRRSLKPNVGKIRPLPEAVPYTRQNQRTLQVDTVDVKQTSGWRNFGLGVGMPDVE